MLVLFRVNPLEINVHVLRTITFTESTLNRTKLDSTHNTTLLINHTATKIYLYMLEEKLL